MSPRPPAAVADAGPSLYDGFARYGSGVTIVSVRAEGRDRFFVAASVLTASVAPFTLAVSVGRRRDALPAIASGSTWAVSVLATQHLPLARRLAGRTTGDERLAALVAGGAVRSAEGPLWLPDALATFWCDTESTTPVHDQLLVVGRVLRAAVGRDGAPLMRWNHGFGTVEGLSPSGASAPA